MQFLEIILNNHINNTDLKDLVCMVSNNILYLLSKRFSKCLHLKWMWNFKVENRPIFGICSYFEICSNFEICPHFALHTYYTTSHSKNYVSSLSILYVEEPEVRKLFDGFGLKGTDLFTVCILSNLKDCRFVYTFYSNLEAKIQQQKRNVEHSRVNQLFFSNKTAHQETIVSARNQKFKKQNFQKTKLFPNRNICFPMNVFVSWYLVGSFYLSGNICLVYLAQEHCPLSYKTIWPSAVLFFWLLYFCWRVQIYVRNTQLSIYVDTISLLKDKAENRDNKATKRHTSYSLNEWMNNSSPLSVFCVLWSEIY